MSARRYTPLTERQKDAIENMARGGCYDREIATHLGIGEYQVVQARKERGVSMAENRSFTNRIGDVALRPRHVRGEVGSDEWFESCDVAFQCAILRAGGW